VLSSLVDSILDLTSQALFWYSDKRMHTPSVKYPAGRRRLEPVVVIISATLMGMAAIEVIQQSVEALVKGFNGHQRELDISMFTMVVLLAAIVTKLVLWYVCAKIASHSPSADALAQVSFLATTQSRRSFNTQPAGLCNSILTLCCPCSAVGRTTATTSSATPSRLPPPSPRTGTRVSGTSIRLAPS
jgi:hypothetical protein